MNFRRIALKLAPPIVVEAFLKLTGRAAPKPSRYQALGPQWPLPSGANPGWDDAAIARSQAARWQAWCDACASPAALDVPHEAAEPKPRNLAFHNIHMSFGYVLALSAQGRDRISMLDWGGGLGHYSVLASSLMPHVHIDYHCKDLPAFCEQGRPLVPEGTFHTDDSCLDSRYDLVVASGSLQCSDDWRTVLAALARTTGGYLYIARLPVVLGGPSVVVRQYAGSLGFNDELLGWFLNRDELVAEARTLNMELVREFFLDFGPELEDSAEKTDIRGFLFRPT